MLTKMDRLAIKFGFDRAERIGKYEGKTVYKPVLSGAYAVCLEYPCYILKDSAGLRLVVDRDNRITEALLRESIKRSN